MSMSANDTEDVNSSFLWEAAEAYLRRSMISYSAAKERDSCSSSSKKQHLERELGELKTKELSI